MKESECEKVMSVRITMEKMHITTIVTYSTVVHTYIKAKKL